MVPDVDVIFTIVPDGEAEALAATAKTSFNKVIGKASADAALIIEVEDPQALKTLQCQRKRLLLRTVGQTQNLLELGRFQAALGWHLVEQISDREFHRNEFEDRPSGPGGSNEGALAETDSAITRTPQSYGPVQARRQFSRRKLAPIRHY